MLVNRVLLVEDDNDLLEFLKNLLLEKGYSVRAVTDGVTALKEIEKYRPELIILDLGLPKMGGETVCIEAKKIYPDLPVIILTAKGDTPDVVRGLNLGADDYIAKPFEASELLARMKAVLRAYNTQGLKLKLADLILDKRTMEVRRGRKEIKLTPQELRLLEYLMSNKGRVLSRDMILNRIWDNWTDVETRVVDVYMGYLRKKVDAGSKKKLIHSIRGFGYTIKE